MWTWWRHVTSLHFSSSSKGLRPPSPLPSPRTPAPSCKLELHLIKQCSPAVQAASLVHAMRGPHLLHGARGFEGSPHCF